VRRTSLAILAGVVGCGGRPAQPVAPAPAPAASTWPVPAGWRAETIPFPLDFAPALAHRGVEELRFPAGFFEPGSPDYWSYAFVWRLEEDPSIDAARLGDELTTYFRGLIDAVDKDEKIAARETIVATAVAATEPPGFALTAHVFDAFGSGEAIELTGRAARVACPGGGALWTFVLSRRAENLPRLADLAGQATCDQRPPP
jgi:hypothetical protein